MLRLGGAAAVIVWLFYMSMIYGSSAMALTGFALIFFLGFSYVEVLWFRKKCKVRLEVPFAVASQEESVPVSLPVEIKGKLQPGKVRCLLEVRNTFPGKRRKNGWTEMRCIRMCQKKPGCYEFCLKKIRVYDLTGFFM